MAARDLAYSRAANAAADLKATSVNAGVRFNPSPASSIGLGVRKTSGEYKQSANDFSRQDVDVTLRWNPSDLSSFSARVSRTQDEAPGQRPDRSLVTSAMGFQWRPTALLGFNLQVLRDTNEGVGTVGSTLETSSTYNGTVDHRQPTDHYPGTGRHTRRQPDLGQCEARPDHQPRRRE